MNMLDGMAELTLNFFNQLTQAWVEIEYNQAVHRETASAPLDRFRHAPDVLRTAQRASRCTTHFAWNVRGASVRAMERFHSRVCGSRFQHGTVTSAWSPCVTPAGTSAESIWSTRRVGPFWLPFIQSTKPPTLMVGES